MTLWIFWTILICLFLAIFATLTRSLLSSGMADGAQDLAIYKDQLHEVERDRARGILSAEEAQRAKLEVSRRLLEADKVRAPAGAGNGSIAIASGIVVLALLGGAMLYLRIGVPGYADLPYAPRLASLDVARADRPTQAAAEAQVSDKASPSVDAEFLALVEQLSRAVKKNPDDLRGQQLLARNEAVLGRFDRAIAAQKQVIALQSPPPAAEIAKLAELLVYAAGGYVSPEAEDLLRQAFARDPQEPLALYLSGLMMAQGGRYDITFRDWMLALDVGAQDAAWRPSVLAAMPEVAARAGQRWTPPTDLPQPSAADVEALSALSDDDRSAAIEGMVESLAARLRTEGGSDTEWARLIRANTVLGRTDAARNAWAAANAAYPNSPVIANAARNAGLAP